MQPVASSNLSAVEYDAETKTLYIRFHSGSTYAYSNVPESIYNGLMSAASKGSYHHTFIKNAFPYKRIG